MRETTVVSPLAVAIAFAIVGARWFPRVPFSFPIPIIPTGFPFSFAFHFRIAVAGPFLFACFALKSLRRISLEIAFFSFAGRVRSSVVFFLPASKARASIDWSQVGQSHAGWALYVGCPNFFFSLLPDSSRRLFDS